MLQVENLSPAALEMASEIMGASTPQDLVQAVRDFTPQVSWHPHHISRNDTALAATMQYLLRAHLPSQVC